jgi:hypothetical protein
VKDEQAYILTTFHPTYLGFKYPGMDASAAAEQLRLDVKMACTSYKFSGLRVHDSTPGATPGMGFWLQHGPARRGERGETLQSLVLCGEGRDCINKSIQIELLL